MTPKYIIGKLKDSESRIVLRELQLNEPLHNIVHTSPKYAAAFETAEGEPVEIKQTLSATWGSIFLGGMLIQNNLDVPAYNSIHLALDKQHVPQFQAVVELTALWVMYSGYIPYTEVNNKFPHVQRFLERRFKLKPELTPHSRVYTKPPGWAPTLFDSVTVILGE